MTDTELNAAACELAGWRFVKAKYIGLSQCPEDAKRQLWFTDRLESSRDWIIEETTETRPLEPYESNSLPSYLTGPEALGNVASLEAMLTKEQQEPYLRELFKVVSGGFAWWELMYSEAFILVTATPRQRLHALLRVLKPELFQ